MLESLLPAAAVAVEAFEDDPSAVLFPAEAALLSRAVDKRRREFTTARICAHRALAGLGLPVVPILSGERGAPRWPAGVVGSITHCAGYRAAAVARDTDLTTLGIDAEPNEPTPPGVLAQVAVPAEQDRLATLARTHPAVHWDRLLFSAKESVYKAWFPLAGRWLGFEDAELTIDPGTTPSVTSLDGPGGLDGPGLNGPDLNGPAPDGPAPDGSGDVVVTGTFTAKLLVPGPRLAEGELTGFHGRWLAGRGLLVTAITTPHLDGVPAGPPPP